MDRIRLEELSKLVCGSTHYEGFQCHICERREMATELLALRPTQERMRQALEESEKTCSQLADGVVKYKDQLDQKIEECARLGEDCDLLREALVKLDKYADDLEAARAALGSER